MALFERDIGTSTVQNIPNLGWACEKDTIDPNDEAEDARELHRHTTFLECTT
jgi:hypothetical protein